MQCVRPDDLLERNAPSGTPIGDEPCIVMQSMSGWPLKKADHSAMIANVGAAARPSQAARPGVARPPPAEVSTS